MLFPPSSNDDLQAIPAPPRSAIGITATAVAGPTLLPSSVASMISIFSKSTTVSIRLGSFLGSTLLDTARAGTLTSLELSRTAVEGIIRRGSKGVLARRGGDTYVEGWASKGMDTFNTSISLAELILSTAFELGQSTLTSISGLAETYILLLDSIFGSTETSRAISEIVKLIREEIKDSAEDSEVGMRDIFAGLTCFAILQYRTRTRLEMEAALSGRLMWDVVVDVVDPAAAAGAQEKETDTSMVTVDAGDGNSLLPPVLFDKFPANAEISVTTTSTTTSTTTLEVVGTSPPDFTLPPGAVVLSESSHHDGRQRYTIVYETVTRNGQSRRLRREDGGNVEVVGSVDGEAVVEDRPRVFEIEDGRTGRSAEEKRKSKRRGNIVQPSGSDAERRPSVPKKTKTSPARPAAANQQRKRAGTTPPSPSPDPRKEREKAGKAIRQTLRNALAPTSKKRPSPVVRSEKLTGPIPARTSSASIIPTIQPSSPKESRSFRPTVTSRPASPEVHYQKPTSHTSYHHRRQSSFSSTTSHEVFNHCSYQPRAQSLEGQHLSRQTSAISLYSHDGDPPNQPRLSHNSLQHSPSIYTLHTSLSTTSLHLYSHPTPENPGPYYPSNFHILHNFRKYIRFAAASYGAQFMKLLLGSQFSPATVAERAHHPEHEAFSFHTSLPVDTILLSSHFDPSGGFDSTGQTGTGRPLVHFVCVDHEASAIVVTCRGTLGLEDVLTDLTCEYTTVTLRGRDYRVHKGIYNSATLLLRSRLLSNLAAALNSYPTYGLVLTGHSLGGGVAALVSILISSPSEIGFVSTYEGLPGGRRIHCYAFGSPAIVCEPLQLATRGLVTTVVNDNDVVPSLSIGVIRDFHSVALSFREDSSGVLTEIRRRFLAGLWGGGARASEEEWNWELAVLKTLRAGMTAEKLLPPGEVWIVSREGEDQMGKVKCRAWVVEDVKRWFGEVRFGGSGFGDHSPRGYEAALEGLKRGVVVEKEV